MKKLFLFFVSALFLLSITACGNESGGEAESEVLRGSGDGYGGELVVEVTMEGEAINTVEIIEESETDGIGTNAIEELPSAIVEANSTDVEVISGATISSRAIIYAVNNALDPESYPFPVEEEEAEESEEEPETQTAAEVYQGLAVVNTPRIGPGEDDQGIPVYSINQTFASTLFDEEGRILALNVDILEVATPNYDGDGMPHFSGFPDQGGYNYDEDHDGVVDSMTDDTEENFTAEVEGWMTKRDRGDDYQMGTGTWSDQMDTFEELFVGKTVEEVEEWFELYTSDENGKPLQEGAESEEDQEKYEALSDEEKEMLADVVTSATMSLNDPHGDIVGAIRLSYENQVPLEITEASSKGFGLTSIPRIGPGEDDQGVPVYSLNQTFATALFDEEDRISALTVDILEVATPNYDGDGMPHFSGFPGQGGYNYDEDHDGVVDSVTEDTEENFTAEVESWMTKRDRGTDYQMGTGTWSDQMDTFEELFVGKTVEEVEEWFELYTSDENGKPLQEGAESEEDQEKYEALSDEEKEMLADVVTSATMSLNDPHGDIIGAIRSAFENRETIDLMVE